MKSHYLYLLISFLIIALVIVASYYIIMVGPQTRAREFLEVWQKRSYQDMIEYITDEQKEKLSSEFLEQNYREFFDKSGLELEQTTSLTEKERSFSEASYSFQAEYSSPYFGEKTVNYKFSLVRDGLLGWNIVWKPQLIYPELESNLSLKRVRTYPDRGSILDRKGRVLAERQEVIAVGVKPSGIEDEDSLSQKFEELLNVSPEELREKYTASWVKEDWFVPIKTITQDEYQKLDPQLRPIPGVFFRRKQKRVYPNHKLASHVIGYIGEVSSSYLQNNPEKDYRPGDLIGKSGIEKELEPILRGEIGYKLIAYRGNAQEVLMEKKAVAGGDVYLNIDIELQKLARSALANKNGTLTVVDPKTGEILAAVSSPNFDPNFFSLGMSNKEWEKLRSNKDQPLFNKVINGIYPPGSVFKLITGSTALDTDLYNVNSTFEDPGQLKVRGNIIRNFQGETFAEHTFADGLTHSINTTFAKIGLEIGAETLTKYAEKFGFNKEFSIPLPVATSSLGNLGQSKVNLAWSAIGQGQVTTTPLQMARVVSVIANEGVMERFSLIDRIENTSSQVIEENLSYINNSKHRVLSSDTTAAMADLMERVVREGTGEEAYIEEVQVAGKTGTAEINSNSEKSHAWFVGFAPVKEPVFAFSVFVEEGGVGGRTAAPIARRFLVSVHESKQSSQN